MLFSVQSTSFSQSQYWNTVHYENWSFGSPPISDVPFQYITHLILFAGGTGGTQTNTPSPYWHPPSNFTGAFAQSLITAGHAAGTKIIVDLGLGGGWDNVANSGDAAINIWASTVAHYIVDNNFDGGDFDLEGSSPVAANMQKMYHRLRDSLTAINPGKTYTLSASVLSNTGSLTGYGVIGGSDPGYQYLDQINPMFYDVSGTFASPLYNDPSCPTWGSDSGVVTGFVNAGLPAAKVGLGYAVQVYHTNNTTACPPGGFSAYALLSQELKYFPPATGATVYWNNANKQSYMINTTSNVKVAYEDTISTWYKADFIKRKGLGGAMGFCLGRGYLPNPPSGVNKNMAAYGMGKALNGNNPPPPPPSPSHIRITGRVFFDADSSGIKAADDAGISLWGIRLLRTNPDTMSYSTMTDLSGAYTFDSLPRGTYQIVEDAHPSNAESSLLWVQTYPRQPSYYTLTLNRDTIVVGRDFGNYSPGIVYSSVNKEWNLISNPVTTLKDSVRQLFSTSVLPYAYAFRSDSGYLPRPRMQNGIGYWEKFAAYQNIIIRGTLLKSDSINVTAGWNLVGSLSIPVPTSSITTIGTSIQSSFFEYNNGYHSDDTIKVGKGYWVSVSTTGKLVFSSGPVAAAKVVSLTDALSGMNNIYIEDHNSNRQKLYFGIMDMKKFISYQYELPPVPPAGIFDARFASQHMVETVDEKIQKDIPVLISSATYPLKIYWKIDYSSTRSILIIDGKEIPLKGNGETQIVNSKSQIVLRLMPISLVELPQEFILEQNYPNPFNPVTTIRYALPKDSNVRLKIFDLLGQEVKTLVDEVQEAGYKSVAWNASNNASGVYFYKLEATSVKDPIGGSMQVKKLLLLR